MDKKKGPEGPFFISDLQKLSVECSSVLSSSPQPTALAEPLDSQPPLADECVPETSTFAEGIDVNEDVTVDSPRLPTPPPIPTPPVITQPDFNVPSSASGPTSPQPTPEPKSVDSQPRDHVSFNMSFFPHSIKMYIL